MYREVVDRRGRGVWYGKSGGDDTGDGYDKEEDKLKVTQLDDEQETLSGIHSGGGPSEEKVREYLYRC